MLSKSSLRRLGFGTAALAFTLSLPALAGDNQQVPATDKAKSVQRYCVVTTTVGSRLPKRICMTREEWLREGFDPLAKN